MHQSIVSRKSIALAGMAIIALMFYLTSDEISTKELISEIYDHGWNPKTYQDVFKYPAVDSQAIRDVCSSMSWNQSIIFTCDNNSGGVGNVRNSILNCVRYAIGAGASLVLPQILSREMADGMGQHEPLTRRHGPKRRSLDYMFDLNHFSESLRQSCPELILIRHMEEMAGGDRRLSLLPESLFPNIPTSGLEHPEEWPQRFNEWMEKNILSTPATVNNPIIIDLQQSFLHYPTHSDGHAVAHVFGEILQFRSDVRQLATKTLGALVEWYDFPVNISRHGLLKPSFLGVHLDTEDPFLNKRHTIDVKYSHYNAQSEAYLKLSSDLQIPIIYAASENINELENFSFDATLSEIAITYKEELLEPKDLNNLYRLTHDQRSLIDFLVLTKAEAFVGVGHSPYSWNVALAREQLGSVMEGKLDDEVWRDGMNTLLGVRPDYVESSACMWS